MTACVGLTVYDSYFLYNTLHCLSLLRFTASDYPVGILKLFYIQGDRHGQNHKIV
jgi:hypothetical protein